MANYFYHSAVICNRSVTLSISGNSVQNKQDRLKRYGDWQEPAVT